MQSAQTIPVRSAPLQFPQSESPKETISQTELGLLLSLRGRLKQLETQIATEEESLKNRLQAGAVVEVGDHTAALRENLRRISWKDVTCRLATRLGYDPDAYTSSVLAHTKPTRTVSLILE